MGYDGLNVSHSWTPCFFVFFLLPFYFLRRSFPLSLLVATQIRGHIVGSPPPSPPRYRSCLAVSWREDSNHFFPRRPALNLAYPRYALPAVDSFFLFLKIVEFLTTRENQFRQHSRVPLSYWGDRLEGEIRNFSVFASLGLIISDEPRVLLHRTRIGCLTVKNLRG